MKNRVYFLLCFFSFSLIGLILRIGYIQLHQGDKYSQYAATQRISDVEIERNRGNILDRNSIPLTNRNERVILVLKPSFLRGKEDDLRKISTITGLNFNEIRREVEFRKQPIVREIDSDVKEVLKSENIIGISFINSLKRYDESTVAKHVLGYINIIDQIGQSGIEKKYEDILKIQNSSIIGKVTDARRNIIKGEGYRIINNNSDSYNVKLTLDYHIQKIVEDILEAKGVKAAVVVQDVSNGNILAMASKPDFNHNEMGRYLQSQNKEFLNRATASYSLGSIFKILSSVKGIEMGLVSDEKIFCEGEIKIGDRAFKCSSFDRGGHGWVDLREAFALSCNTYFIELGLKIGYDGLVEIAQRFGLGQATGIGQQGVGETSGKIPLAGAFHTLGDIANISIGQGIVLATPIQVADIVATIANDGIKNKVNIVDSIVDSNGKTIKNLVEKEGQRIVSKRTSEVIKSIMEEVVDTGTGQNASTEDFWGVAGKTGSAQTGQIFENTEVVHAWFAGYFPRLDPKYSISVFVENGKSGGGTAAPLFKEIAEQMLKKGF